MAGEEQEIVRLKNDFYRDGFNKALFALATISGAIVFLIALSVFLHQSKPPPVYFSTDKEWRILPPVPLNKPYLTEPDLLQWVSEVVPSSINFDFVNYQKQFKNAAQYFTSDGWNTFLVLVNAYANEKNVQDEKLFINTTAGGAPIIIKQGLKEDKYAWLVQMPLVISGSNKTRTEIKVELWVVRAPTLNNLYGVVIDSIAIVKGGQEQSKANE